MREATGHNDGVEVEHMLAMVGMPKGCSWCGAFVYTAMCEAGVGCVSAGVRAFAWAPAWHPPARRVWTKARGINSKFAGSGERLVMPGDVFGLYFTNLGRIGHVGLVVRDEGKFLVTLEGNTNDAGSREGDGVFHKRRRKDQVYCVSRWNC
ncbi:MAG: hypothetical protein ABI432_08595 [Flavobacteriales bacterium]